MMVFAELDRSREKKIVRFGDLDSLINLSLFEPHLSSHVSAIYLHTLSIPGV